MEGFEIIDSHIHLTRNPEEESNYWLFPGRRACDRYGTPERAIEYMDRVGISNMCFMTLIPRQFRGPLAEKANLPSLSESERKEAERRFQNQVGPRMREINEWGTEVAQHFSRLHPFSSIARELGDAKDILAEVELRASQGAKGIKMHPGMFSHFPDDEELFPAYAKCEELGLPILADSGAWPTPHMLIEFPSPVVLPGSDSGPQYAEPEKWSKVAENFPKLKIIMAHFGSAWWDERVEMAQKYANIYFDTSQGFNAPDRIPYSPHRGLAEADCVRIFRKVGIERILFGTDFPALAPQPQLEQLLRLALSDDEKQKILAGNARRIIGI